jgi:hypothetical protein
MERDRRKVGEMERLESGKMERERRRRRRREKESTK